MVRASQPLFLILISVGAFVFGASIIPMAIDDGHFSETACNRACMSIPWLISLGWSILFSALYAKIRRVNLVVHNVITFKQVKVSERDVMAPFALMFTANMILLVIWTVADPLSWKRNSISATESYGTCSADPDSAVWKTVLTMLSVLNGVSLIGANVEAWKARKIDTEYGESTYIGLIMASILQVVLVGVPLIFLVRVDPTARFFVSSSMAFIISMSVLSLLFVPKVLTLRARRGAIGSGIHRSQSSTSRTKRETMVPATQGSQACSPINDVMVSSLKAKVKNLENLLREAGIDGSFFIQESGLDDLGSYSYQKSAPELDSSVSFDFDPSVAESSRFESLPPVVEENDDDLEDRAVATEPIEPQHVQSSTNTAPRSSISIWLQKKRNDSSVRAPSHSILSTPVEQAATLAEGNLVPDQEPQTRLGARIAESMRGGS